MLTNDQHSQKSAGNNFDAVVIGAGFSGLYMLHRLREAGFSAHVYEAAEDVGGVWYTNRYPGARCDSDSIIYNYTFSEEILQEWTWSSRYPEQPEILSYLNFVADKLDLRRDIQFKTRVDTAHFDEANRRWNIQTDDGASVSAKFFISGVGILSTSNIPNMKGLDSFKGQWYHTGNWPHEKVDFRGKRVGVIGTGSSGVQSIPVIAQEAEHLTVFQRTPAYATPARNHPYDETFIQQTKANYNEIKQQTRNSNGGFLPVARKNQSALEVSQEERNQAFEAFWQLGGFGMQTIYNDLMTDPAANETAAEFIRSKISETVKDPEIAKKLMPSYYYAAKRPVMDTNYYETYNRDNVTLLDVKSTPIVEVTPNGVRTTEAEYEIDILVFATGFDGMTGSLFKIDICGKNGVSLKDKWENGEQIRTHLGLATAGFPNFFMITGPQSPSAFSNMPVSIEQHVEWIGDCMEYLREHEIDTIEANLEAEEAWSKHCTEVANSTLFSKVDSWYTGANIEGKARGFSIYIGGVANYRKICDEVAAKGYEGFSMASSNKAALSR